MYVEPVYLKADQGELPELKRVIVSYEDAVVMEPTLEAALARVFGEATPVIEVVERSDTGLDQPEVDQTFSELAARANEVYTEAVGAQRDGDWAGYGDALDRLGLLLERMAEEGGEPEPETEEAEGLE